MQRKKPVAHVLATVVALALAGCTRGEQKARELDPIAWGPGIEDPNTQPGPADPPGSSEPPPDPTEPPPDPTEPPPDPTEPPPDHLLPDPDKRFEFLPLQADLETYEVKIDPGALAEFYRNEDAPLAPATFIYDGAETPIQMRLRGNSSRSWPKKSWRIEFPEGTRFQDRRKLNLLSEWREQTLMVEKLGYDLLEAMGVPASRAKYVRMVINGVDQGVYVDLQRVDKHYLRFHGFLDEDADIYRCAGKNCEMKVGFDPAYQQGWDKEDETNDESELESILRAINYTPESEFAETLERRFELELYLRTMVMEALISMDTVEDSGSYFLFDAVARRWHYSIWDLNNTNIKRTFGDEPGEAADPHHPLFNFSIFDGFVVQEYLDRAADEPGRWKPIFSNLNTRIVANPVLRARLIALMERALDEVFTVSNMNARIDATYALLEPYAPGRPHTDDAVFFDSARYMKEYVASRIAFIRQELEKFKEYRQVLVLEAVNPGEGWIELRNPGTAPVSTAGMVISTSLRDSTGSNVPARTIAPGATERFTSGELGITLAPEGEIGLFDGRRVLGVIDLLFYGGAPAGKHHVRSTTDPSGWEIR